MYNLNVGVTQTALEVARDPKTLEIEYEFNGYFKRNFVNKRAYYNGEDVKILPLGDVTKRLVKDGYTNYGKW